MEQQSIYLFKKFKVSWQLVFIILSVFVFITGCSKSSEETASSPVDHPIVAASAPEISDVPSETEVDVLDMEQEEPVDKAIPPAAVEEPEVPAPPVIVEPPLEVEVSAAEFAYAPGLKELDAFTVSERILNEQKLLADLLKNKPLIINFKINVEYQEPREIVQAAEPEPAVVEVPVVEAPVIETAEPDRPTIVEYRLKDGLVIVVESGPKIAFKPEPASEIDIKSDSIPVLEEEIINPAGSPFIEILSPGNRSFYTKKVQIEGRIANSVNDPESVSEVETATWEIEGKKEPEELVFGSDGVFFFSFSADSYSGILNILIRAEGSEDLIARKKLILFDGNVQPELILTSPENESVYGAALHISGTVTDPSAYDLGLTGPAGMEYSLFPVDNPSTVEQISGTIPVNPDGSFSEIILSGDFSGEQLVTITVHGRNGKTIESSVSILESMSDIPGFRAGQDDDVVKLIWNSFPGVKNYNLFYTDAGIDPADEEGNMFPVVESPVLIRNLREGFLHRFQLEAVSSETGESGQETYRSGIAEMILLKPDTLKPVITSGYQQITLVWPNIPGTKRFDILRRDSTTGSYRTLEKSFAGNSYVDRGVVFGKNYSYRIRPSLEGSLVSTAVSAESLPFPEEKTVVLGEYGSSNLQDIEVAGSYIFLANGTGGMRIVDNADPARPVEVSRYPSEDTKDIVIRGERAYVADGFRGIKILDINDPGNPILLGSRKTIDAAKLALMGDTVFIADGEAGVKIIDISSERRPERTGSLKTVFAKDLVIRGSELFIADGPGGFKIVDIAGSPNLKLVSTFKCDDAAAITADNDTVYIADSDFGVRIIDTSDSSNPVEIGQIPMSNISDILVSENYLFTSNMFDGMFIYEISDPHGPVLFDFFEIEGATALTLNEGVVYLTNQEGFKMVKSFTTGRSFVIAEYQTDGKAYDLTYMDKTLYLADHRNGVKIVDVSNPTDSSSFFVANELDTTYAESVVGYGSRLLIADGAGGVVLGEISYSDDGSQHIEIQESIDLPGITKSLVVYGNTAFVAAREEGMHLLDLETREISTVFTGGAVQEIAVTEELIFVADGSGGLKIYNNTDNTGKPELLATVPLSHAGTVAVTNNYAVAGGRDGLSIIDVSVPREPVIVSSFSAGWIEDIHLEPGYIYAAAGHEGLIVLDMKKPEDLVLVSSCEDVYAVGVEVEEDLAFVADVDGFKVVKILIPSWLQ